ncbi:hypothetical protein KKG41_01590 [Patescibacteria group bacterium]|nr:hypothetical protein [Patescibacteria group bacterium]
MKREEVAAIAAIKDTWCCVEVKKDVEGEYSWGRGASFRSLQAAENFLNSFCESQRNELEITRLNVQW